MATIFTEPLTTKAIINNTTSIEPMKVMSGEINLSPYLGAGLGLLNAVNTFNTNSQINDTSYYDNYYNQFGNQTYTGDFENILAQRRSAYLEDSPSWEQIRGMTRGQKNFSLLSSAASGAMAGAGFGLLGAGIGGVIGGLSSLLGSNRGDDKAKEEADRLSALRSQALTSNTKNFLLGMDNATKNVNRQAMINISALGGPLHSHGMDWTNGIVTIDQGGTHESNPYGGVQVGIDTEGIPNLVEEGEVIWNDYVFSNRIKVPKKVKEKYKFTGSDNMTFADLAKRVQKPSEERPNDFIERNSLVDTMEKLRMEQEKIRSRRNKDKNVFGWGGLEDLRFAPAIGTGIMALTDALGITNKPNYADADIVSEAAGNAARGIKDVSFTPIDYTPLVYVPFDRNYSANQLMAQSGATRRAIKNNSNGNRATAIAGLLGADLNYQMGLGNLYRQADEYNLAQKERIGTYNMKPKLINSEGFLKAALANAENSQKRAALLAEAGTKAAALRQAADAQASSARSANLTGFLDNTGGIGIDATNRADIDKLIKAGLFGTLPEWWGKADDGNIRRKRGLTI